MTTRGISVLAAHEIYKQCADSFRGVLTMAGPNVGHGRYPYRHSSDGEGFKIFWSPGQTEVLIEISGEGCEKLHKAGKLKPVVYAALERLTRVDIATDILTEVQPAEFVAQRSNKRHKSHESTTTSTGKTEYIGSRKSDRYCRVYRYAKPHPRADYLRVECVYRGPQAVALARTWLEVGDDETAARAGNQYGWQHPDWEPKSREKIQAWRPDRKTHKRLMWYKTQVVPAVRGMVATGHLSPEELLIDLLDLSEGQKQAMMRCLTSASVGDAKS